ncbi:MAG TPA: hypothetical protein EYP55_08885 [Anaerolineae bacterium]|nr:hypothetical protein [Anaerolineae bacterium]
MWRVVGHEWAVELLKRSLANAIAYVQAAVARGLDVDDFAPRLSFFFAAQSDLLEEVAKFRAARRLWARIMRERFGAEDPRSWTLRFHAQTAGAALTAQQPENNIVRVAIQALAAVLGGAQSLHCNAMDEALALPSETSARIALRTQQIIAHESGVTNTVDPLGGSYFVEALTNEIEARVVAYLERIEGMGGALKAIEAGFVQREIQESAYRYQRQVEDGGRIVVGVNKYVIPEKRRPELLRVDPAVRERQIERLRALRERRDNGRVRWLLDDLEEVARSDGNLMPPILACVEAYATLGEICEVLRGVFGEHKRG